VAATIIIILDRTACIDYRLIWQSCRLSGSESEAARWYSSTALSTSDLAARETFHEAWLQRVTIYAGGYEP
jgi:hypothetical protein